MKQADRVLEAFEQAPNHTLTTAQIHAIPYMTNARARISDLRKLGHVIMAKAIRGKHQSTFVWYGQLYAEVEEEIRWIGPDNGYQINAN